MCACVRPCMRVCARMRTRTLHSRSARCMRAHACWLQGPKTFLSLARTKWASYIRTRQNGHLACRCIRKIARHVQACISQSLSASTSGRMFESICERLFNMSSVTRTGAGLLRASNLQQLLDTEGNLYHADGGRPLRIEVPRADRLLQARHQRASTTQPGTSELPRPRQARAL